MAESREPPKPRGRPKADEPRGSVSAWVPTTLHDQLIKRATQTGESVSTTIRRMLTAKLNS